MENNFKDFSAILDNFDAFCDEFESRAAEAFMRGDQNNGKVVRAATERLGGETPSVVTEIRELELRVSQLERPTLVYRRPKASGYESLSDTLDYLHNNVEGIKKDLLKVAQSV